MRVFTTLLPLSLWATSVVGCVSFSDALPEELVMNECSADAQCGTEGSCDVARGMCVAVDPEPLEVVLQFLPPVDNDLPAQVRGLSVPSAQMTLEASTFESATVRGAIFDETDGERVPVPARISFVPRPVLDPDDEESFVPSWAPANEIAVNSSAEWVATEDGASSRLLNFEVLLRPDLKYEVTVQPLEEYRSRLHPWRGDFTTAGDASVFEFGYSETFVIRGEVTDEQRVGREGLQVRALDLSGRVVSSTATTDANGAFEVSMSASASAGPYGFRFEVTDAQQTVFEAEAAPFLEQASLADGRVQLVFPSLGPSVLYTAWVEEPSAGDEPGRPIAGVSVTFDALLFNEGDTAVRVRRTETSDAEGQVQLSLPPSRYDVVLRPASTEGVNVRTTLAVATVTPVGDVNEQSGQVFSLKPAIDYQATVFDSQALPVPDVPVRAEALGVLPPLPPAIDLDVTPDNDGPVPDEERLEALAAAFNRSADAVSAQATDATGVEVGQFNLRLDPGYYDLSAQPAEGSGFPWAVHPNLPVLPPNTRSVDLQLLPPVIVEGDLLLPDGSPASGATVQALRPIEDLNGGTRAVVVGRVTVDEQGHYMLLLAPRFNPPPD